MHHLATDGLLVWAVSAAHASAGRRAGADDNQRLPATRVLDLLSRGGRDVARRSAVSLRRDAVAPSARPGSALSSRLDPGGWTFVPRTHRTTGRRSRPARLALLRHVRPDGSDRPYLVRPARTVADENRIHRTRNPARASLP